MALVYIAELAKVALKRCHEMITIPAVSKAIRRIEIIRNDAIFINQGLNQKRIPRCCLLALTAPDFVAWSPVATTVHKVGAKDAPTFLADLLTECASPDRVDGQARII